MGIRKVRKAAGGRQKTEGRRRNPRAIGRSALILLAGALAYANCFSSPFVFDDFGTVVRNPQILRAWDLTRSLVPPADTAVAGRPLANLTFAINYAIGGFDVRGYHAVNLALHLACALLIFGIVRRTLDALDPPVPGLEERADEVAFACAALWVVHPLNSEVVDYVTQRTESLMAVCYLLTMYASIRALQTSQAARWRTAAVLSCLAGVFCKETIATAPVAVLLYDRAFVFGSFPAAFRARSRFYIALSSTWVVMAVLVAVHGQSVSAGFATANGSAWNYFLNQPRMLSRYLWLALWPQSLVVYYGWPPLVTMGQVWPYLAAILMLFALTLYACARYPRLGFLGAWFFLTLGPTSSLIPIATEVGAERRMYLPLAGLITLFVAGVGIAARSLPAPLSRHRSRVFAVMVLLALPLGVRTFARNREYSSALTLAETVLARWPSPNAHQLVGTELAAAGRSSEAIEHLRTAAPGYPPARYFLGSELIGAGRIDEGIAELETFIREEPRVLAVRTAHGLLANAYAGRERFADALPHYREYLAAHPRDGNAWTGLGIAQVRLGLTDDSLESFRRAAQADPANGRFQLNLARAHLERGELSEARRIALEAAAGHPDDPAAHDIIGRVLLSEGRIEEARRAFERALQIDPAFAPAADGLRSLAVRRMP